MLKLGQLKLMGILCTILLPHNWPQTKQVHDQAVIEVSLITSSGNVATALHQDSIGQIFKGLVLDLKG